jgi:hypothetical protein
MTEGRYTPGARFGVWGINPYGEPIKQTPGIESAIKTAGGIGNLFAKKYANDQAEAKARLAQGTVDSQIEATNSKNQTDLKYYPLMQAAKLQQEQATIKEIMARTGVSYAQAKHIAAQTGLVNTQTQLLNNPFMQTSNMIKQFESLPDGSKEKIALGATLDNAFAGGMFPKGGKNTKATNSTMATGTPGLFPGLGGAWYRDPRTGTTRGGAGSTYTNPETGEMVSSNTSTQTSRDQRTIAGAENVKQYVQTVKENLPQFQTLGGRLKVGRDAISNFLGGTNYDSPSKLAMGDAALKASAEGFINTFGLNATEGNVNTTIDILRPRFGESPKGYDSRVENQLNELVKQEKRAQQRLAGGNPVGQGEPASQGYFSRLALGENPEEPAQPQAQSQLASASSTMDLQALARAELERRRGRK